MGTVTPEELLQLYTREALTIEMTLGHILQNLVKLRQAQQGLRLDVDRLLAFTDMEPQKKSVKDQRSGTD